MGRRDQGPPAPSWLVEPCPSWCAREHEETDHPEDRYHQSDPAVVPAIASTVVSVPVTASFEEVDLVIRRCRYVADSVEWMAIEGLKSVEPRLVLTSDSARVLLRVLAEQLG